MKIHNNKLAILGALAIMLAACSDKKEYVPGEPDAPDCMGVYFAQGYSGDFIFIPGQEAAVTIKLGRLNSSQAADVPLICSSTVEGISFPATAHFDSGCDETEIVVDCSGLPLKQQATFNIDLPDQYINHYAATLFNYQSTVLVSAWEPANKDGSPVVFYFTSYNYITTSNPSPVPAVYQPVESEMEVLPGASLIRVQNFLNSGVEMTFSLSESTYPLYAGYYRVSPVGHWISFNEAYESDAYGDSWYNPWFVLDDEEEYAEFALVDLSGKPSTLDYPFFYWFSDTDETETSYMAAKTTTRPINSVCMGVSGSPVEEGITLPANFYLFFSWDGETGL